MRKTAAFGVGTVLGLAAGFIGGFVASTIGEHEYDKKEHEGDHSEDGEYDSEDDYDMDDSDEDDDKEDEDEDDDLGCYGCGECGDYCDDFWKGMNRTDKEFKHSRYHHRKGMGKFDFSRKEDNPLFQRYDAFIRRYYPGYENFDRALLTERIIELENEVDKLKKKSEKNDKEAE